MGAVSKKCTTPSNWQFPVISCRPQLPVSKASSPRSRASPKKLGGKSGGNRGGYRTTRADAPPSLVAEIVRTERELAALCENESLPLQSDDYSKAARGFRLHSAKRREACPVVSFRGQGG